MDGTTQHSVEQLVVGGRFIPKGWLEREAKEAALVAYGRNVSCRVSYPEDVLAPFEAFLTWADDRGLDVGALSIDPSDMSRAGAVAWVAFECEWESLAAREVR